VTLAEGAVERPPEFLRRDSPQEHSDAVVTQSAFAIARWEQPPVVVNLDRAILYAPALE